MNMMADGEYLFKNMYAIKNLWIRFLVRKKRGKFFNELFPLLYIFFIPVHK